MEKLSSIVDAVKERLSSPLFGSYAIAWLLWNWQVPVALLWFDTNQLHSTASWNYVDYISGILNFWSWAVPALFVAGYTVLLPVSRWVTAMVIRIGNDLVFKASKESKVSFEHYYTVLHGNKEKAKHLEEMIENQKSIRKNLESAQNRVVELETLATVSGSEIEALKTKQTAIVSENLKTLRDTQEAYLKNLTDLNVELDRLKRIDETIYSVWKMVRYDDTVIYIEFTNFYPTQIEPSFLAKISPTVVYSYMVMDAVFHRNRRTVIASRSFDDRPTDYFYLFKHEGDGDIWGGYENGHVIKTFERLPDSDFHVKI